MTSQTDQSNNQRFFDTEDGFLRTFWDPRGKHHWGLFEPRGCGFAEACDALELHMANLAQLDATSSLLDVGCGNGVVAAELCAARGCDVVGVDLSPVRIENARRACAELPEGVRTRIAFEHASATALPFPGESFSHAWSQATLFRVPERGKALAEVYRVLRPSGRFVMDDLFMPTLDVSPETRQVYDRWNCESTFSFDGYRQALVDVGFEVLAAEELSPHLVETFRCLHERTERKAAEPGPERDKYATFSRAYASVVRAIESGELGWGLFLCQKAPG